MISRVVEKIDAVPGLRTEYYQIVDDGTMQPVDTWDRGDGSGTVGCVTVFCGDVRLIDNIRYN